MPEQLIGTQRPIEIVLSRLQGIGHDAKVLGDGKWQARCPAHADGDPSLSITEKPDGTVLCNCFAGCAKRDIVAALGLTLADLFPPRPRKEREKAAAVGASGTRKEYKTVPAGTYTCRVFSVRGVESATAKDNGGGSGETWQVTLMVLTGPHKGARIFDRLAWQGEHLARTKAFCAALGFDVSGEVNVTQDAVTGRTAQVDVTVREVRGRLINSVTYSGYSKADEIAYDYQDADGKLLYQVVRLKPKAFFQRRPNGRGGWIYDLQGVERVPYRLPELATADPLAPRWIVEGEKDADYLRSLGLLATTSPQGAGKWTKMAPAAIAKAFHRRVAIVLPDNDEAGFRHAEDVRKNLDGIATSIRVLALPGLPVKGDVSDWLAAGGTREELERLAAAAPTGRVDVRKEGEASGSATRGEITNYEEEEVDAEDGPRLRKSRTPLDKILKSVFYTCDGWPKRLGESLFVDFHGDIKILDDEAALFSYLHLRADLRWVNGMDDDGFNFVSRPELFKALVAMAECVTETAEIPLVPTPPHVYVTSKFKLDFSGKATAFYDLLCRFQPHDEIDEALIQAMALTPFWGGPAGSRPLFVITGPDGIGTQETGKTTLAELLALPAGGVFHVSLERGFSDGIAKQIMSDVALSHRVMLIDNLSGIVDSNEFSQLITAEQLEGRPSHGRQRRRTNYFTWIATAVSPQLDRDLATRSVVIHLDPPDRDKFPNFRQDVEEFIRAGRKEIVNAAAVLLAKTDKVPIVSKHSRFPAWDAQVLATHSAANDVLDAIASRREEVDARQEAIALFAGELISKCTGWTTSTHEVNPKTLAEAWNEANGTKLNVAWVIRKLMEARRTGLLGNFLQPKSKKKHGSAWFIDLDEARRYGREDEDAK